MVVVLIAVADMVKVDMVKVDMMEVDSAVVGVVVVDVVGFDVVLVDVAEVVDEDYLMNYLICFGTYHQLDLNCQS